MPLCSFWVRVAVALVITRGAITSLIFSDYEAITALATVKAAQLKSN